MPIEEIVISAVALGIKATEKFFDRASKRDSDVVGIGLAVGYFYNFLDPVSTVIESDQFVIFASQDDKVGRKFEADDIRVQIIVPNRLDVATFKRCEDEFKTPFKGLIYLARNKRFYGINYALNEMPSKTELTIIDLARPIMSAKQYYENIVKLDTGNDTDEKWLKTQVAEITAFKETLRGLQKRGYGVLVNKLDFRERS
jgi:hypothetical protein